jgi:hypothetical protein
MDGIRGNNFIGGPNGVREGKGHRHSDIYFGFSGDVWPVTKFSVVLCSRGCHGSGSGVHNTLLHLIQSAACSLLYKVARGTCQGISDYPDPHGQT